MRQVPFSTADETFDEQRAAGRYNPALVATYRDKRGAHRVTLDSGRSDDISCWREGAETFFLSVNHDLGYCGLQRFTTDSTGYALEAGDIFLQNAAEALEDNGATGRAGWWLARCLAQYLD